MAEKWKDINGYEGFYQISNNGRVRSWRFKSGKKGRREKPFIKSQWTTPNGYRFVGLWRDGHRKSTSVHKLVAMHFIPNPKRKPQVNHKDGVKSNNHVSNLEWVTCSENILHSHKNGMSSSLKGEESKAAKLTETEVLEIRAAANLGCFSHREIAESYSVNRRQITRIINRKRWAHV